LDARFAVVRQRHKKNWRFLIFFLPDEHRQGLLRPTFFYLTGVKKKRQHKPIRTPCFFRTIFCTASKQSPALAKGYCLSVVRTHSLRQTGRQIMSSENRKITKYLLFWGKARREGEEFDGPDWHPAAYHSLDVAAVAKRLQMERHHQLEKICKPLETSVEDFIRLTTFLIALHDIGKFSRSFQALVPKHWPTSVLDEYTPPPPGSHWQISHELMAGQFRNDLLELLNLSSFEDMEPLIRSVAGHHGKPPSDSDIDDTHICNAGKSAAKAFMTDCFDLLHPCGASWLEDEEQQKKLSFYLAGLTVAADWLGSNHAIFQYEKPDHSLADYWHNIACPRAEVAVEKAGLMTSSPAKTANLSHLFGIKTPRPMQQAMAELPLLDGPMLVIIEDATGSGKTEAAALLAQRMMQAGKAGGFYFALPTMATANGMFTRMARHYRKLFVEDEKPSLALAHGRRALDKRWYSAIRLPNDMTASLPGANEETAAQCAQWIADDRRKTFFAQIGVGTIDQALLAVLPSKFQSLRLWGLCDRVLIIDEAHAYDAYMSKELETLLEFHAANGGSAIILSATLPRDKCSQLIKAFRKGLGQPGETQQGEAAKAPYPLVTIAFEDKTQRIGTIEPAVHTVRRVQVKRLPDMETALTHIEQATRKGAAVAYIRNAVDDAIEAVAKLRQRGIEADLFHARYAMGERQKIEGEMVNLFGKEGGKKRQCRVLVATQVIEQSLDLDFDLMISDLAPVDLLIQRAGRLWRHMDKRPENQRPVEGPKLLVVSPDPGRVIDDKWLKNMSFKGSFVYPNHALLWRTAKALFEKEGFAAPDDLRRMIEYVYGDSKKAGMPGALAQYDLEGSGKDSGDRTMAGFNLLNLAEGYSKHGSWYEAEETLIPTRLGEPTQTIRLARIENERLAPLCEDNKGRPCWPLSEISVRTKWLEGAQTAPRWHAAAEAIKKDWPKWQQKMLIAPVGKSGALLLESLDSQSTPLTYGKNGLEKTATS
jgi:CRISPR-associated endonuclease/helicase Cas3